MGYTTLIVLAGTALLGACSGMVGTFAVLRRRALMGDALAHAALPGVCIAFLLMQDRHLPAMLLGALATGLLGVLVVTGLRFGTRIKEDAAIGIVLSVFYGAGIALVRYIQNSTARGNMAGLNSYILGKTSSMILGDVYFIAGASLLCLAVVVLLFKEFQVVAFDPEFAHSQGWPAFSLDLLLMVMVAVTVVIGLPAVGAVLVAALLIVPAAAARFWTERLGVLLVTAAGFGAATGAMGTLASSRFEWAAGPAIVLVGAGLFALSMLFGPRRGFLRHFIAERRYRRQVAEQALLRRLFDAVEARPADDPSVPRAEFEDHEVRMRMFELCGWVETAGDRLRLTDAGLTRAAEAARADRMVDLYLAEYAGNISESEASSGRELIDQIPPELRGELESRLREAGRLPAPHAK